MLIDLEAITSALQEVADERVSQINKWGQQNWPDGTGGYGAEMHASIARRDCQLADRDGRLTYRHILDEEVAEAFAETDRNKLKTELIQVAAVAVAWVEKLIREEALAAKSPGSAGVIREEQREVTE